MTRALLKLEVFEIETLEADEQLFDACQVEEVRLAAYEQGYGAGWQDALNQMRDDDALRKAATLEALQVLNFTYHEARASAEQSAVELLQAAADQFLPEVMRQSMPGLLAQELQRFVQQNSATMLQIFCAPQSRDVLEAVIAEIPGLQADLVEEPSFTECQVSVHAGHQRRNIDLDGLLAQVRSLFSQPVEPVIQKGALDG